MTRNNSNYNANPNLKRAFVPIGFTPKQILEIKKCKEDPYYFFKNYYYVKVVGRNETLFEPYPYQKEFLDLVLNQRYVICKMSRQCGKSTIIVAYMLWNILFHTNRDILLCSKDQNSAIDLLSRIKFAYEKLPFWLQQGITRWDQTKIELENKSSIVASATTLTAGRSGSYYLVFLDEFAFVNGNMVEEFYTSIMPTISSSPVSKLVIVSTPNGMNFFYRLYTQAEKQKNPFKFLTYDWTVVPNRDRKWANEQIAATSAEAFDQEYNVLFVGSSNTLISPAGLKLILEEDPAERKGKLDIWEYPKPGNKYVISVDSSEGVGQDYSVATVIDVTEKPYKLVAKYRDNRTSLLDLPNIVYSIARKYNFAYILVEVNSIGMQVANTLWYQLGYENMFYTHVEPGRLGQRAILGWGKNRKLGVRTTDPVKRTGCANLKDIIENQQLIIKDFHVKMELSNFVRVRDTFAAKEGETDDIVMTLVLFAWLAKQELFEEMTNTSIQKKHPNQSAEELHIPFPIRYDYSETFHGFSDSSGTVWEPVNTDQFPGFFGMKK